jgi:23S rRNA (pseudouridine1915-N3)-methyltransferase
MKARLICVGKVREPYIKAGVAEYLKRLRKKRVVVDEIPDSDVNTEGKTILRRIKEGGLIVALSENGVELSSMEFAELLKKTDEKICFIVGGPDGLSKEVLARADKTVSLSKLTFTHEMARVILLEQIYRAVLINEGRAYHR